MVKLGSAIALLLLVNVAACSSNSVIGGGSGGKSGGSGGTVGGSGGSTVGGSGGSTVGGSGGVSGSGGSIVSGSGGSADAGSDVHDAAMTEVKAELAAGAYNWDTCDYMMFAQASDWCDHYEALCGYNFPTTKVGGVPLANKQDCMTRYNTKTCPSKRCRSNYVCDFGSQVPPEKNVLACDFDGLQYNKCDGVQPPC